MVYEGETLDGVPHGYGRIIYIDPNQTKLNSMRGWVHMVHGKLHGGPAVFEWPQGDKLVYSNFTHGKGHGVRKWYHANEETGNVSSMQEKFNIQGWLNHYTKLNGKGQKHDKEIEFTSFGSVEVRNWHKGKQLWLEQSEL